MAFAGTRSIETLDGWRGIAISLVLVQHYLAGFAGRHEFNLGQHGVQIFFVLSGYLITSQLLSEDHTRIKAFYIRRAFRILPPAFLYLLTLVVLTAATPMKVCGGDIWACLLFFRNYIGENVANTCTLHFWSLSLEEQFYLFWPAMLLLLGRRSALFAASGLAIAIAIFRFANWSDYEPALRYLRTEVRADGLLVGCALALLLQRDAIRLWLQNSGAWLFWIALPVFVLDVLHFQEYIPLHESLAIAVMLSATSLRPESLPARVLEWDFLKATGMLSYSIYIWQGLFLRPNWGGFWLVLLASSVLFSYFAVEQPARRLGRRIAERYRHSDVAAGKGMEPETQLASVGIPMD